MSALLVFSVRFFLGLGSTSSGSLLIDRFFPCSTNLKSVSPFGNCSVKKSYYVPSREGKKDLKIVLIFFKLIQEEDSMVLTHHHFELGILSNFFHSIPNKSRKVLSLSLSTKIKSHIAG